MMMLYSQPQVPTTKPVITQISDGGCLRSKNTFMEYEFKYEDLFSGAYDEDSNRSSRAQPLPLPLPGCPFRKYQMVTPS
jgi:hypothetical protein